MTAAREASLMCAVHSFPLTCTESTHAKHRLAAVNHWLWNRCHEQCESWVTPALLFRSTSSPVHGPTSRDPDRPGSRRSSSHSQATSRSVHFPSNNATLFFSGSFPHRGQKIQSRLSQTQQGSQLLFLGLCSHSKKYA